MTRFVDLVLELDDLHLGAVTVGVPLHDGHGLVESEPGVLADGRQLERPVWAMLARQAEHIRAEARLWLSFEPPEDPAATAARLRARAENRVAEGPILIGHRGRPDAAACEWYVAALARAGARLRAELLRRMDPARREEVRADDLADLDARQTAERATLERRRAEIDARVVELDQQRRAMEIAP